MENKQKTNLSEMMETSMSKVREMVSSDTVIGQPITTPDGVTLVPVSRLSFGFSCGGSDFGNTAAELQPSAPGILPAVQRPALRWIRWRFWW